MSRTVAREEAFKILFQTDVGRNPWQEVLPRTISEMKLPEQSRAFLENLVKGTVKHLKEIDGIIINHTREWSLERLANTDRNILRLAIYELKFSDDVPAGAVINEAVELAKKYGDADSGKFVNGILGQIAKEPDLTESAVRDQTED